MYGFFFVKSENIEIFVKAPFQFLGCAGLSAARIYRIWPECLWAASRADCWCTEHRLWTAASCSVIRHLRGLRRSAVWTTAAEWIRSARKYVYNFWLAFCLLILDLTGVAHLQSQDSHIYILKKNSPQTLGGSHGRNLDIFALSSFICCLNILGC